MTSPADRPSPAMGRDPIEIAAMDATVSWLAERKARNQFIDEHGDLETGFYLGNLHARRAASQDAERLRSALQRARYRLDDLDHRTLCAHHTPSHGEQWCDCGLTVLLEEIDSLLTPPRDPQ